MGKVDQNRGTFIVSLGPDAQNGCPNPTPKSGVYKPCPICLGRPTHQPIKLSSTDYLAMFIRLRCRIRVVENLFDFA